jgi:lipopolysaccharide export system protein LptA
MSASPGLTKELAERAGAFRKAERHTRVVRVLRLALPLAAATCLAFWGVTLGVSWKLGRGNLRIGEVTVTADDLTMKNPSYFGQTRNGGHYDVRAKKAVLEFNHEGPIKLIDISGDLVQTNAVVTNLKAKHGLFDNAKSELELFDGIEIAASSGLKARLSRAMIYAKENRIVSNQPVEVSTAAGRITGAAMTMKTDTHEATFVGDVAAHLVSAPQGAGRLRPAAQGGAARGAMNQPPVDITSDNLYVNDATKSAIFMGGVIATRGDTRLRTPELHVAYEGKGAEGLASPADQTTDTSRLSRLVATSGCVLTFGSDRRVTSDQADFDPKADTALFTGNVLINQDRNVLQGQRLFVERKAGKSRLDAPANGGQPAGRIAATFYQNEAHPQSAQKSKAALAAVAQGSVLGSFKADPNAPIDIEADTLDVFDGTREAVFRGNVKSQQGDFLLRTVAMTAFYSGQTGIGLADGAEAGPPAQLIRVEAREQVLVKSKDGQTATGDWAIFDVKANTVLMGDHVIVSRGKDVAQGPRLKIDLTTGMYRFELESEPASLPAASASPPQSEPTQAATADPAARECPPGKQCVLFYPKEIQDNAKLKEKANERAKESPKEENARELSAPRAGWEPSNSASPVLRGD